MSRQENNNNNNNNNKDAEKPVQKRLILLDRDGVINEDVGSPGVLDPRQLVLTPQAGQALGNLKRAGYQVAIVTNQSSVGKGLLTEQQLHTIHITLQAMLLEQDAHATWDALYQCTTSPSVADVRRKPGPGMLQQACREGHVSPEETVFVGDTLTDLQAAHAAGISTKLLVATGYGQGLIMEQAKWVSSSEWKGDDGLFVFDSTGSNRETTATPHPLQQVTPFVFVRNLKAASDWILANERSKI